MNPDTGLILPPDHVASRRTGIIQGDKPSAIIRQKPVTTDEAQKLLDQFKALDAAKADTEASLGLLERRVKGLARGPRPTPIPVSARKVARRRIRASRRYNR